MMDFFSVVEAEFWVKIVYCVACGVLVGTERQFHRKPLDVRTCVMICIGTMSFIHLGAMLDGEKDSTRVLGQVVTGIGFLGAGAIFTRQGLIVGLTSASVVWVLASAAAAIGFGHYAMGVTISLVTVAVLMGLHIVEDITTPSGQAPK